MVSGVRRSAILAQYRSRLVPNSHYDSKKSFEGNLHQRLKKKVLQIPYRCGSPSWS